MDTSGKDFALQFHGLNSEDPSVRERFRAICLAHLDISDKQAFDILSERETRIFCSDVSRETINNVTRDLLEIGIRVDVAEPVDPIDFYIPAGTFIGDDDSAFEESQLFERTIGPYRTPYVPYSGPSGGYGDDTSLQDYHFSVYPFPEHDLGSAERSIQRHAKLIQRRQALSVAERAGLAFVACALLGLAAFFMAN